MSTDRDRVRRAASQDRDPDAYVVRLCDLRVALAEVDRLTASLAEAEATIAALRRPPTYEWAHNLATQRPGWTLETNGRSDGRTGIDRDGDGYRPHAPGPIMPWCATSEEAVDVLAERLGHRVPVLPATEKP